MRVHNATLPGLTKNYKLTPQRQVRLGATLTQEDNQIQKVFGEHGIQLTDEEVERIRPNVQLVVEHIKTNPKPNTMVGLTALNIAIQLGRSTEREDLKPIESALTALVPEQGDVLVKAKTLEQLAWGAYY